MTSGVILDLDESRLRHFYTDARISQSRNSRLVRSTTLFFVFLHSKSVTSCFLNKKFVFVFQPRSGNRVKPDQLRFVRLKNHSIYPNPEQGMKIRKSGRVVYLRSTLNSLNISCNANL